MKKRPFHDPDRPSGGMVASPQTVEDLALAQAEFAAAEAGRARAIAALARVTARRDGEAAVGMPLEQWLRAQTLQHGAVLSGIGCLLDVQQGLPTVWQALQAGEVCLDQTIAVARPAARLTDDLRRSLDAALDEDPGWKRWDPDLLAHNVDRLLEELQPRVAENRERSAARRQFLHVQPELDGQAIKFWGRFEGVDAALFEAAITRASEQPKAGVPRGPQRAAGLLDILNGWAAGRHRTDGDAAGPAVTIHLLIEEEHASRGVAAQVLSATPGFSPRLTSAAVAQLTDDATDVTTITSLTREGVPVKVAGRAGHAIDNPDALSEDSVRELVRWRDGTCATPGCSNPITDFHHIVWRIRGGRDDPSGRAGLCRRCHHRIAHDHGWTITINPDGSSTWTRQGLCFTTLPRHRRILRPPRAGPDPPAEPGEPPVYLDRDGEPLPF